MTIQTAMIIGVTIAVVNQGINWLGNSKLEGLTSEQKIEVYNSGYRSGAMNTLAEMVECEGVTDAIVLEYYRTASDTLARMGELDTTAYPCYE